MSSVIKNRFSTVAVDSFLKEYGLASSGGLLYMGIGRDAAWTNEITPPVPLDQIGSLAHDTEGASAYGAQNDVHGMVQIAQTDIQPVIPRKNWTAGTEYNALRNDIQNPYEATDWYVLNSSSQVWKCTSGYRNSDGDFVGDAGASDEPTAVSPTLGQSYAGTDSYTWEYMYTISGVASNALTTNWMPINYSSAITGADNSNSLFEMGCHHIMLVSEFGSNLTIDAADDYYRQVTIYDNPVLADGSTPATSSVYDDPQTTLFATSGFAANLEKMIYQENRTAVQRSASQIAQMKIVVEF